MQNDTISRSALVAELECYKMSLGDIVLRFVVDRVIDIVKAHPGVALPKYPVIKCCDSCIHFAVRPEDEPCVSCVGAPGAVFPNWEGPPDGC